MPRLPGWAWLLLAIGFATLASYMAMGWLKRQAAVQSPKEKTSIVVVAKNAVAPTSLLSAEQFKTEVWHQEKPPQGSFNNLEQLVGRVTATSILPGDLITEGKLAPKGSMQGITALLSPNQRAMTVKVDEASGVAGFLTPGNRVDVVVVVDKGEYNKDPIAKLLFQNLRVLGTGQKLENRAGRQAPDCAHGYAGSNPRTRRTSGPGRPGRANFFGGAGSWRPTIGRNPGGGYQPVIWECRGRQSLRLPPSWPLCLGRPGRWR